MARSCLGLDRGDECRPSGPCAGAPGPRTALPPPPRRGPPPSPGRGRRPRRRDPRSRARPASREVPPAHHAHRLDRRGPVERLRHRCATSRPPAGRGPRRRPRSGRCRSVRRRRGRCARTRGAFRRCRARRGAGGWCRARCRARAGPGASRPGGPRRRPRRPSRRSGASRRARRRRRRRGPVRPPARSPGRRRRRPARPVGLFAGRRAGFAGRRSGGRGGRARLLPGRADLSVYALRGGRPSGQIWPGTVTSTRSGSSSRTRSPGTGVPSATSNRTLEVGEPGHRGPQDPLEGPDEPGMGDGRHGGHGQGAQHGEGPAATRSTLPSDSNPGGRLVPPGIRPALLDLGPRQPVHSRRRAHAAAARRARRARRRRPGPSAVSRARARSEVHTAPPRPASTAAPAWRRPSGDNDGSAAPAYLPSAFQADSAVAHEQGRASCPPGPGADRHAQPASTSSNSPLRYTRVAGRPSSGGRRPPLSGST